MPVARRAHALLSIAVVLAVAAKASLAQKSSRASTRRGAAAAPDTTLHHFDPALRGLRWRNVGPMRGGRVVAVAGDPDERGRFYFGAANGGVWRTTNAGLSWQNITDDKGNDISSVGAIAVAPSDHNVIWVGTGESELREDLTYGNGMWRSTDGGETWQHVGLEDSRHIAVIQVHPDDPDVAYVAAMGHAFGPNAERGVFRTRDGGKTWQKILYIDENTGAIDVELDPTNPRILYAAMWRFRRTPWGMSGGGGNTSMWKSIDGGDTWKELTANKGIPKGPLGRIGFAVSSTRPSRVYAVIEARPEDSTGGIFRSDDAGRTWERTNGDQEFMVRPWYYSRIFADPKDENTVYTLFLGTWRSVDGGREFSRLRVPHGDDHVLWIDPDDPRRMIEGNDGGATISLDGGATWSTLNNQPTAQFYHVITDDQFPYRIYGSQQDNTPLSIASRSDQGAIGDRDWWPIGGGEAGYIAVDPTNPSVTYGGDYMGTVIRGDHRTQERRDVSIYQNNWDGLPSSAAPYRFQWTFPITFSPHDPKTLYIAAQNVFASSDGGVHWRALSPDLTLHDLATMGASGGPVTKDMTGTEWYATIFAFAESPKQAGVLWAGSDDGLVHVSRDGGAHWANVTPAGVAKYTRMSVIEPSHFDAGTAYLAANRYQLDDFRPYLYRTTDYGKTWTKITAGIPEGAYTRSIREDPVRRGLLYAGTETGVYVSFDDGAHWQSLQLNLPRSSVRDLAVHGSDLIAATHGRAFWILDDISPLRQVADSVRKASVFVFTPEPALRFAGRGGRTDGVGANPPEGLILDYSFREKPTGTVTLDILDPAKQVIRTFTSASKDSDSTAAPSAAATRSAAPARDSARAPHDTTTRSDTVTARKPAIESGEDSASYAPSDSVVSARAGANRFVWNLRYPDVHRIEHIVNDEGTFDGPTAVPGRYTARLTVGGKSHAVPFTVVEDPRVGASLADLQAQFTLLDRIASEIDSVSTAAERIQSIEDQLDDLAGAVKGQPYASRVDSSSAPLKAKLDVIRDSLYEVHSHADEITLHYPVRIYNQLLTLNAMVQTADATPTPAEEKSFTDLAARASKQLAALARFEQTEVAQFNAMMRELQAPAIAVPGAVARRTIP